MIWWTTWYSENWKRKQAHIAFSWGYDVNNMQEYDDDENNPEFVGQKELNWSTKELEEMVTEVHGRL
jgi:hypothetical protein